MKRSAEPLVLSHLPGIKPALLEGEKRPAFLEFSRQNNDRRGLYTLYDANGRLHYAGTASDLPRRLDQHLNDRHSERWDEMTLFFLSESADIAELEGLIVAAANPPGNKQKPQVGSDKRKELWRFLKRDAMAQIDHVVYPRKKERNDVLSVRMTAKKLKGIKQAKLASVLGVTQGRISQLVNEEPNHYAAFAEIHPRCGASRQRTALAPERKSGLTKSSTFSTRSLT